jgi:hypothetical protein
MEFLMLNDQQPTSLFNFIHRDHECLPRSIRLFWNTLAAIVFIAPFFIVCTSCLGVVLGLDDLQAAYPVLAHGYALGIIAMIKGGAIGLTSLLLTMATIDHQKLAQHVRDQVYETIEDEVMPFYR